jgi:AraC-like DNA-binding protein
MNYRQIQPKANLRSFVRYFGLLENDHSLDQTKTFKIIADGCPGLIFQEDPNCFLDKDKNRLPQLFLHGLTTGHSEKTTTKRYYRNIGVYFQPSALKSVFGIDACELTNRYTELNTIIKNDLSEKLLEEDQIEKRIEILSDFILQQLKTNSHKGNHKIALAIEKIQSGNSHALDEIQSSLNLSERSLERVFNANVGIPPKLFLRINRFQTALDSVRRQIFPSLTETAHQYFYADQSHFIREFKEFAGASPKHYLLLANEQALNFPEWKL